MPDTSPNFRLRAHIWRLPLVAVILVGLLSLRHLDHVLRREYRSGALAQAAQGEALLEGVVQRRVAALHNLTVLLAGARSPDDRAARFALLAPAVRATAPDLTRLFLLDDDGAMRDVFPRQAPAQSAPTLPDSALAATLAEARTTHLPMISGTAPVNRGAPGILVVDPVLRGARVVGYVVGTLPHGETLGGTTAVALAGNFAYRVVDDSGRTIGAGGAFPERPSFVERRRITLPGGRYWELDVAVPRFEPVVPRVLTWLVGLLLLALVTYLVLREEARAERFAQHSLDLELLSRDLLDANLRLEDRAQQVAEANRAKSRFLANVSHELRTPLNAIVGYNGLALDGVYGELAEPLQHAHARIRAASDHLLGVVNNVLDLSKIEVGRMHVEREPTDLGAVLDSVATVLDPIASAKGIRVDVIVAPDLPRLVTDPRHVRQIVLNLASNAVKFTERGSVTIVAERDRRAPDRRAAIVVRDTGIGIAEENLTRIFDEFEQVRPEGRGDSLERGTGLGLAIARKLARLLDGDVEVTSRLGEGSSFVLTLPLRPVARDDHERASRPEAELEEEPDGRPPTSPRTPEPVVADVAPRGAPDAGISSSQRT